jgi:UDPglucose 6-dehydrogenase
MFVDFSVCEITMNKKMRISVAGTGYVGLCTAVCFADNGYQAIASSHDKEKVTMINEGIPPFYEPQLEEILRRTVESGGLRAVHGREEAVLNSDITFITVGTPSRPDGSVDLSFIEQSAIEIGNALKRKEEYHLVVTKSTIVPGTTQNLVKPAVEKHSGRKVGEGFGLCMSPEFLREGTAIYDTLKPDRVVIGEYDERSGDILEDLLRGFHGPEVPILRMNLASAEMVKYANNCMLATKISFINEIANICENIEEVDVVNIARGIGLDHRIGPHFLRAGAGWGGSCFPKDVKALIAFSRDTGYEPEILDAVVKVNQRQAEHMIEIAKRKIGTLKGKKIAILGLSFKPDTDDMREAPSIKIIKRLLEEGANVSAYDPKASENARRILGDRIEYCTSTKECTKGADCCLLVTEWQVFKKLKPEFFKKNMATPILIDGRIDGRRIYDTEEYLKELEFAAIGMG